MARSREQSFPLSTNCYPGAVHPSGYQFCTGFTADPWPTWTFECRNSTVQREIFTVHGRDLVIVRWSLLGKKKLRAILRVRPKLSGRDYHATHHENGNLSTDASTKAGTVAWRLYTDLPPIQAFHAGDYRHGPEWYRQVEFPVEQQRGLDHREDWWSPGEFTIALVSGTVQTLALTSEDVERLDVPALTKREQTRRKQLAQTAPTTDSLAGKLWRATDAYLSERGDRQSVIAGYPWFTDWGRDTFISLPGLCLVTGQLKAAWKIIAAFSAQVSEGMIPNRFPDAGEQPEYNTIDASLWFIHAIDRYFAVPG